MEVIGIWTTYIIYILLIANWGPDQYIAFILEFSNRKTSASSSN
jgi:hypothetical protein